MLLTALVVAVADWCRRRGRSGGHNAVLVDLEGHGREEVFADVDLSRTVGWFTSLYPVRLDPGALDVAEALSGGAALGRALKLIKSSVEKTIKLFDEAVKAWDNRLNEAYEPGMLAIQIESTPRKSPEWKGEAIRQAQQVAELKSVPFVPDVYVAMVQKATKSSDAKSVKIIEVTR